MPYWFDQKIPDWLIKIAFLEKVKTAVKSVIKARFGTKGFSTSDVLWGLWFFSLTLTKTADYEFY